MNRHLPVQPRLLWETIIMLTCKSFGSFSTLPGPDSHVCLGAPTPVEVQ